MLSIENPPDPSTSCHISRVKSDERATQKLALQEADLVLNEKQLPGFSIRDYVFTARSKDIGANWPFPQQFLQLCVKHGVKDLLPPFEPPDSVRARSCKSSVGCDQVNADAAGKENLVKDDFFEENVLLLDSEVKDNRYKYPQLSDLLGETSDQVQSPLSEIGDLTTDIEDNKSCRLPGPNEAEAAGDGEVASAVATPVQTGEPLVPTDSLPRSLPETTKCSGAPVEPPYGSNKAENSSQPPEKKCRLLLKLGTITESSRAEELISNSSSVSEPMASKVCPVCKTFSSTSNTTLNAHIDRCLADESASKKAVTKLVKHKVKPRKKRSMVDIYTTAPRCTLEELERRNGRSVELSSSTSNHEVQAEGKRQRLSPVDFEDDGNESAVYVDSNGTKVLILSKFNDSSAPKVGDGCKLSKQMKVGKEGGSLSISKKKRLASKSFKFLKVKPQNKKLCSIKPCKDEIPGAPDGKYHTVNHEKVESSSQLLKARDPVKTSGSGSLRQWVCSKRTGLSKKSHQRDDCPVAREPMAVSHNPLIESNQSTLSSSAERSQLLKFSRSTENSSTSPRSKRLEILSSMGHIKDDTERKSSKPRECNSNCTSSVSDECVMKFPRSPGNCVSSARSKRMGINTSAGQMSPKLSETHSFSPKAKKISTLRKNPLLEMPYDCTEVSENIQNEEHSPSRNPQKDKFAVETDASIRQSLSDADEGYERSRVSGDVLGASCASLNESHTSDNLNSSLGSEVEEDIISEVSLGRSNLLESGHEREEAACTSERREAMSLNRLNSVVEHHSPDTTNIDLQVGGFLQYLCSTIYPFKSDEQESFSEDHPVGVDAGIRFSAEKSDGHPILKSREIPMSNNSLRGSISNMPSELCHSQNQDHGDNKYTSLLDTETRNGSTSLKPSVNQEMRCAVEVGADCMDLSCSQTPAIRDGTVPGDSPSNVQQMGCCTESAHIQGPEVCVPSSGDTEFEALQENLSVTLSRSQFGKDKYSPVNRDSSGSPFSATSAIFNSATVKTNFRCLVKDASFRLPAVEEKPRPSFSDCTTKSVDAADGGPGYALQSIVTEGSERTNVDRGNPKVAIAPTKEITNFSDDQPCCCSRKEIASRAASKSHESQLLREGVMATRKLPNKAKQMNYVNSGTGISPFSSASSSRINEMIIPVLESPKGSISLNASPDAAAKFPGCSDFSLESPSSQAHPQTNPNPILRLMGKNLMVMNHDEDDSLRLQKVPTVPSSDQANAKYLTLLGFSPGYASAQDSYSFCRKSPDSSMIFSQDPCNHLPIDSGYANGFRGQNNTKMHQTALFNHPEMSIGGFAGPSLQHGSKGKTDVHQPKKIKKSNSPFAYDVESSGRRHHCQKSVSTSQAVKEVIVIDDSPEVEVDSRYTAALRENQSLGGGVLNPAVLNSSSRQPKAFSCFPSRSTFSRERTGPPKGSFLMPCPGTNAASAKRGSKPEGSGVPQSRFILPSPSTVYLNSAMYYSPSLR